MALWSKMLPQIEQMKCQTVAHPWTDNCVIAAIYTWLECFVGSAGFFGFLYLCQFVSKVLKKKKKKADVLEFLKMYLRSTIFGATLAASTFSSHCFLRRLFGKYSTISMVFLPAFMGGHSIYIDSRKARELYTNAFANCYLELLVKFLEKSEILKWNPNSQTVIFMILCSFLSFLLSWTNFDLNYFWFFLPPKVTKASENDVCFHEGDCKKNIFNFFVMYSSTGLVLQFLKLLMNNFKNPKFILYSLTRPRTFRLSAFLGGYAVIYQTIRCFLYQKEKKYSLLHDSLAGFLAGISFRFQPTIPIFNSAIITAIQICTEAGWKKKMLPNLPYLEVTFTVLCGLLFHYRILGDYCPRLTIYFMSGVTHGLTDRISQRYNGILNSITENPGGL